MMDNKYIERMLMVAGVVAGWSTCPPGRQHGCVLAVDGKYIVSTGYNGTSSGMPHCPCEGKPKPFCEANCEAVHAEVNAVINAARVGAQLERCVAYVTKEPCVGCWHVLHNAGIWEVHYA
jgi:dCMP deaminase